MARLEVCEVVASHDHGGNRDHIRAARGGDARIQRDVVGGNRGAYEGSRNIGPAAQHKV